MTLGQTLLAAFFVLTSSLLKGQENDDALFIDEDGNVTVRENLEEKNLYEGEHGKYYNFPQNSGMQGCSETRPKNIYVNSIIKSKHIIR